MADILSQEEIDSLLDVCTEEIDYGSDNFEEAYIKYDEWRISRRSGFCPSITAHNPQEIMNSMKK